jgi:SCY1-like protein 1
MGNSASSLPYAIGKQTAIVNDGWALHEGTQKSDGSDVSVFVAKKAVLNKTAIDRARDPSRTQLEPALHHFSYCKKLRHPHILQVLATLDTDHPNDANNATAVSSTAASQATKETGDLIIVTERCVPLDVWLQQENPPPEQLAWGLEVVVRALHFLHASANLAHGNISPASFFVTRAGDVKLWNFVLVTPTHQASGGLSNHFQTYEDLLTPQPYRSPERQQRNWAALAAEGTHAMDSFGLALLIAHFYGGTVPPPLQKAVQRLQTPNVKMRPRLQPLLKCPLFETPYQKLQLQLEEFMVKPVEEKIAFWQNLTPQLQAALIPENLAVYKLMRIMKSTIDTICQSDSMRSQDMYRRELSSILKPLFFVGEHYLDNDFGKELTSTVSILFTVNDRGIRGALLQKASLFSKHLDKNTLNQAVFEPVCSGFSDSSSALRELTLKATLGMVPCLTPPSLEKLSRYLVRLQSDPEASIRTNTVIFLRKLAPHLTDTTRHKMLLPAYVRALKDPFTPCRLAALQSVLTSKEFFEPNILAGKVLPAVTPSLLDGAADVRKEAFTVVDDLLFALRQESERMNSQPDASAKTAVTAPGVPPSVPQTSTTPVPSAPSSGGYLTGLSSWMTSSAKPTEPVPSTARAGPPRSAPAPAISAPAAGAGYTPAAPLAMAHLTLDDDANDDDGGWGDDDLDVSEPPRAQRPTGVTTTKSSLFAPAPAEDDFFGSFDAKPVKQASLRVSSAGKLSIPAKKTKPVTKAAITKLAADDNMDDGWDEF